MLKIWDNLGLTPLSAAKRRPNKSLFTQKEMAGFHGSAKNWRCTQRVETISRERNSISEQTLPSRKRL
jgi:hypothetical protein